MISVKETTLFFKDYKASFVTTSMRMVQVVNLLDFEKKNYTSLLLNSFGENYAFTETSEDIIKQENNPVFSVKTLPQKKTIAGLECQKAIVSDLTNKKKFIIFFYPKVKVYLGNSPYKNFNYLLVDYQDTRYGLPMRLQATKIDFNSIDTTMLNLHGEYNWVDRKDFLSIIQRLKPQK